MAHNITERDGIFTVREPAWHKLGTVFTDYPTREEAQKLVHPWEPVTEPLYRKVPYIRPHTHTAACAPECTITEDLGEEYVEIESGVLNSRSDDGSELGVVSPTMETVTNNELWEVAQALEDSGSDVMYESGGSLKGGRKVWVLIRLKEPLEMPGDPNGATIPYYALQNSHDGTGAFRGQATMTRIVCDNTSLLADLDAQMRGTEFVFRHTKNIRERIEDAREALAGWRHSIEEWKQFNAHMMAHKITIEDRDNFLTTFIPEPEGRIISERVRNNIRKARDEWLEVWAGLTNEGVNMTAMGLVHASVEYSQHYRRARSAESRFKRAYLDRSELTSSAVAIAREVVGA